MKNLSPKPIKEPLVSILIPTYNQDLDYLVECINSAINQTYKNREIIVSDNHSTNGTAEVLKEFKDSIKVVKPKNFLAINSNFDFCSLNASGRYYSFLCSDDVLFPGAIERLVVAITKSENISFAFGNIIHDYDMPKNLKLSSSLIRPFGCGDQVYRDESANAFFFPWSRSSTWMAGDLIDADVFRKTGGFSMSELYIGGDNWITKKLLELGGCICIDEPLALFRMRRVEHVEADRDRRLLEFSDRIILASENQKSQNKNIKKYYDCINLIQRLGEYSTPTSEAVLKVKDVFVRCNRGDLVSVVNFFQKNRFFYQCLSKPLLILKNQKNRIIRFVHRLKIIRGL